MFCSKCGNQESDTTKFCGKCGNDLTTASTANFHKENEAINTSVELSNFVYPKFSQRFWANVIDNIIFGIVLGGVLSPLLVMPPFYLFVWFSCRAIYQTLMESSKFQASIGKMATKIYVVDANGNKLEKKQAFIHCILRELSYFLGPILFLFALFNEKRETLHDKFANCVTIVGKPNEKN